MLQDEEQHLLAAWLGDDGPLTPEGEPDWPLEALDALCGEEPPEAALDAMRDALDTWWAEQSPVIYYDSLASQIGQVYVAVSEHGLVSIDFGFTDEELYLEHLREAHVRRKEARIVRSPERVSEVTRQLGEYFEGKRDHFDCRVDLSSLTPFQRQVLDATRQIHPGEVVTYKDIAHRIGKPGASRAVGNALGRNPVPIIIPCHRVLPRDGALGGYSGGGGPGTKARLLALEGVLPGERGLYATP
jgi:methylated-DNA-[protein]-cysteine S-methyltransferase